MLLENHLNLHFVEHYESMPAIFGQVSMVSLKLHPMKVIVDNSRFLVHIVFVPLQVFDTWQSQGLLEIAIGNWRSCVDIKAHSDDTIQQKEQAKIL